MHRRQRIRVHLRKLINIEFISQINYKLRPVRYLIPDKKAIDCRSISLRGITYFKETTAIINILIYFPNCLLETFFKNLCINKSNDKLLLQRLEKRSGPKFSSRIGLYKKGFQRLKNHHEKTH